MRKQLKRDLIELLFTIPKARQPDAAEILNEIVATETPLAHMKHTFNKHKHDAFFARQYEAHNKRYRELVKLAIDIIPKTADGKAPAALTAFIMQSSNDLTGLLPQ